MPRSPTRSRPPSRPAPRGARRRLGLRYLTAFAVIVVTDDALDAALAVATEAAAFAGAHLVVLVPEGSEPPADIPAGCHCAGCAADSGPDGAFAASVGSYAAGARRRAPAGRGVPGALAAGWEPSVA